jgi:hypothetical protein
MARTRTFSFATPAHGRAAEACGIDVVSPTLPRSSAGYVTLEALLVAVEARFHLLARRVTPRLSAIEAGRRCVQADSSITHVTAG